MELFDGEHLDVILRDTPDPMRPPSLIAFFGHKTCPSALDDLDFKKIAEHDLPSRERLLIAKYDIDAAPLRSWYEWVPERDLATRYNVTADACPTLAFVPRHCNGWTEWCVQEVDGDKTVVGCADFGEQCSGVEHWDGTGSWQKWVEALIDREGEPQVGPVVGSFEAQREWIIARDDSTSSERARAMYMPPAVPSFSETGFKSLPTPPEIQDWLLDFYHRHYDQRKVEPWTAGLTQNSFHETVMYQVDLDLEYSKKTSIGDKFLRPLLEEWTGVKDLEVTSIYGIREYHEGHWLGNHIDREDTHVISATFCIDKMSYETGNRTTGPDLWPLEFTAWDGKRVRYDHSPGTVILYESVKGIHGRPYHMPRAGGIHIGAFFHYRPPKEHMDWLDIAAKARRAEQSNLKNVPHRSAASVEPARPVLTAKRYGEGSQFERAQSSKQIDVVFKNTGEDPLTLFWRNDEMAVAQCSPVTPKKPCTFGSFPGHQFFWTAFLPDVEPFETHFDYDEIPEALPGSTTTVKRGQKVYTAFLAYDEL